MCASGYPCPPALRYSSLTFGKAGVRIGLALLFLHVMSTAALSQEIKALDVPPPLNAAERHIDRSSAFKVDCNKGGSINAKLAKLSNTGMTRSVTILVSGTCKENVLIEGCDCLNLVTTTLGTSINDPSGGTQFTVDIEDSQNVSVQGFTINGGAAGPIPSSHPGMVGRSTRAEPRLCA